MSPSVVVVAAVVVVLLTLAILWVFKFETPYEDELREREER